MKKPVVNHAKFTFQDEIVSIHNCKILETVVQQGSFVKAASELNLTPSAVSHAIAKLEQSFGILLFMRTRKGISLTPAGEHIFPYIRSVRQSNELLYQEVNQLHALLLGTVCISAFDTIAVQWLPKIIRGFHALHPNIEIKIYQSDYYHTMDWIRDGVIDLAFVTREVPDARESFQLFTDQFVCVTPVEYQSVHEDYVTIEDLRTMNILFQRSGYNIEVQEFLERNRLRTDSSLYIENKDVLLASVESNLGCCISSQMSAHHLRANVRIFPILPKEEYTVKLIATHPLKATPATREMWNYIIQSTKDNQME